MSPKKEMSLNSYPYHNISPFIGNVIEQVTPSKTRKVAGFKWQDVLNEDTGELEKQHMMVLATRKEVDSREFIKIYQGQLKGFYGLSKSSFAIVDYIMQNIKYSEDRVCLFVPDLIDVTGLGYTTVYRSISQLIEKKMLAKADRSGCYFINPQIFFKGDTITLINQYVKKEAKIQQVKRLKK